MARTIRSIIISALNTCSSDSYLWISPGALIEYARAGRGYEGTEERLLRRANELAEEGVIESRQRGMMQNHWFRRKGAIFPD